MMKQLLSLVLCALIVGSSACWADVITEWNFEDTTDPDIGIGSVSLVGGTTAVFDNGPFGNGNRSWFTSGYAPQRTESGQRGIQFLFDTTGFTEIRADWIARASGNHSNWYRIETTIDGGANWAEFEQLEHNAFDTFDFVGRNFDNVIGSSDNAEFGIRFVAIFSPLEFTNNGVLFAANQAYEAADFSDTTAVYSPSGHFAFDQLTITATAIPEPSSCAVLLPAVTVWAMRRYRRREISA